MAIRSMDMEIEDNGMFVPYAEFREANAATSDILPSKSREIYEKELRQFNVWRKEKAVDLLNEDVLLEYFSTIAKTAKASTLWCRYSMLKATLKVFENVDISRFNKLKAFIKIQSRAYVPKKPKTLERHHIEQFLIEAPNNKYLMMKVALLVGIFGACNCDELTMLSIDDIQDKGSYLYISLPDTKTHKPRSFTIFGEGYAVNAIDIYKMYAHLRPINCGHRRFFLNYKNGKCTIQPVGRNTLSKIPRIIATYLKLPGPESYTGHCLRRSSSTLLVNAGGNQITHKRHSSWKAPCLTDGCVEDSETTLGGEPAEESSSAANVQMNISSDNSLNGRVNRGPFVNPILERVAGLIKPSLEGLIRSIEDDTEGTDEHEAEKTEAVVLAEGSVGPNGVIKITGTADAPELLRTLLHPGVKRPTSSGNIGSTGSERLESCAEASTSTSGTPLAAAEEETTMASPTPSSQKMFNSNWSKFRRSVLNNLEEPLAKALRAKIESVQKNTQMASEEHLWKKELHNLRIEHEKEFHKIRLEKEVEMLKQEKAKADREQELLKQERIRTERILKQTFSS